MYNIIAFVEYRIMRWQRYAAGIRETFEYVGVEFSLFLDKDGKRHVPYIQTKRYHFSQFIYFNNAVHVSGVTSTHHQELGLYIQLLVFVKPCCYLL
jgi:hypothetical protein